MIYVIPDTHLGHENIKKYCDRPNNFEKIIEKNWNEIIKANDTVIHLGDVSFEEDWIKKLGKWNGRKILIRGNHDKMPMNFYLDCGFTAVLEEMVIDIKNVVILFSHRPKFNHGYDINIHGHQHNLAVYDKQCYRYLQTARKINKNVPSRLYYLTKNKHKPSPESLNGEKILENDLKTVGNDDGIILISYQDEILNWLEDCSQDLKNNGENYLSVQLEFLKDMIKENLQSVK